MQHILLIADFHGVTRVIAALITNYPVSLCGQNLDHHSGQNIDHLAFALITPLRAD